MKPLAFVQMWKEKKEVKEIRYWNLEETEAMHQHARFSPRPKDVETRNSPLPTLPYRTSKERFVNVQMGVHRFG